MAKRDYHHRFYPNHYYHIYNRSVDGTRLFSNWGNYGFFLSKWDKYLLGFLDVYAYTLVPNHFHFLVKVKSTSHFNRKSLVNVTPNKFLEGQFKKLFTSYALAYNKQQNRKGNLFTKRFKRIIIDSQEYLTRLIHYIHHNPIHHGLANNYVKWGFSSYKAIISEKATNVNRDEVLKLFGGKYNFIQAHKEKLNLERINNYLFDE